MKRIAVRGGRQWLLPLCLLTQQFLGCASDSKAFFSVLDIQ